MAAAPVFVAGADADRVADIGALADRLKSEYLTGLRGVTVPQRMTVLQEQPFAAFDAMPAHSDSHGVFITKVGAIVPQSDSGLPSVHSMVLAFSTRTGKPLALLDGDVVTNLKCAAVTALVTDVCAARDASVLGLIGTGVQAREQIRGVGTVRRLRQIRIHSRDQRRVASFIRDNAHLCDGAEFIACASANEAAQDADIISTATTSTTPVLASQALNRKPLHINCLGNHTAQSRELPLDVLEEGTVLIVEDLATAVLEAGNSHRSAITIEQLMRRDAQDLQARRTVFASTGHAFLDLAAVVYLLQALAIHPAAAD